MLKMKSIKVITIKIPFIISILSVCLYFFQCSERNQPVRPTENVWIQDVNYFSKELKKRHKNLFYNVPKDTFESKIEKLKDSVYRLQNYEIVVELMKIITLVGDAHTNIFPDPSDILHELPIKMYWFTDGLYVIESTSEYQQLLGKRVTCIGNVSIDEVYNQMKTVIPHENSAQIKNKSPQYMRIPEVLAALNIINNPDSALFTFEDIGEFIIPPLPSPTIVLNNNWITVLADKQNMLPLYLQNDDLNYWYTFTKDSSVIYAQYNSCSEMESLSFSSFAYEIINHIDSMSVNQFIFDMRMNGGGNSMIAMPLINGLQQRYHINQSGNLFVIIGRKTFSSAVLNSIQFKNNTNATFVGEATGGKPNSYGEVKWFSLPNSGIIVCYSTEYFYFLSGDPPSFFPDITVDLSFEDYENCIDPVLDYITNEF